MSVVETVDCADLWQRWKQSGELIPAFQPLFSLASGRVMGYEALSRFRLDGQLVRPDWMFKGATLSNEGFEADLLTTRAILEKATELPDDRLLFINLTPQAISHGIVQELIRYNFPWSRCVWEVTEDDQWDDEVQFLQQLTALKNRGSRIAIDDFGSGYSNFVRLFKLLPEFVKIDIEIVRNAYKDPTKQAMIESLVSMSSSAQFSIVAEGIESSEELLFLKQMGADIGQGFLLERPQFEFKISNIDHLWATTFPEAPTAIVDLASSLRPSAFYTYVEYVYGEGRHADAKSVLEETLSAIRRGVLQGGEVMTLRFTDPTTLHIVGLYGIDVSMTVPQQGPTQDLIQRVCTTRRIEVLQHYETFDDDLAIFVRDHFSVYRTAIFVPVVDSHHTAWGVIVVGLPSVTTVTTAAFQYLQSFATLFGQTLH